MRDSLYTLGGFKAAFVLKAAQALQEHDEGFLHHVLGFRLSRELPPCKGQQAPLIAGDEL